jgi:hypothetical protein
LRHLETIAITRQHLSRTIKALGSFTTIDNTLDSLGLSTINDAHTSSGLSTIDDACASLGLSTINNAHASLGLSTIDNTHTGLGLSTNNDTCASLGLSTINNAQDSSGLSAFDCAQKGSMDKAGKDGAGIEVKCDKGSRSEGLVLVKANLVSFDPLLHKCVCASLGSF